MTVQMLFYENAVPVSARRHAGCSVEVRDYGFCRNANSVPLTAVEFRSAAGEYPIVFGGRDGVQPLVVLGLHAGENLFVSGQGAWTGRYIPAFVRRYPFVFSTSKEEERFLLCVDEAFPGFNREDRGERLFAPDGKPSVYAGRVLRFLQEYRAQWLRTRAFCLRLKELDLLAPMEARYQLGARRVALGGFAAVDREKLKALSGERLAQLAGNDELELIYLHLHSMRNFDALRARLPVQPEAADAAPAASQPAVGERVTIH